MENFIISIELTCPICGDTINNNDKVHTHILNLNSSDSKNDIDAVFCTCRAFGVDNKSVYTKNLELLETIDLITDEIEVPEGYKITDNNKVVNHMRECLLKDEHCPCQIQKTDDTLCICKQFKDTGICKCGLWVREE
jgi:hypothetical protein